MLKKPLGISPQISRAVNPLRTAVALGVSALALVACGGGSDDSAPAPVLAAPANFTVDNIGTFGWAPTPGATRYELFVDPDGAGPLPESKADGANPTAGTGFSYQQFTPTRYSGSFRRPVSPPSELAASLNSSYRVRACDDRGCGDFTAAKSYDVAKAVSHPFASGLAPLKFAGGMDANPRLSSDGLTLAIGSPSPQADSAVNVFTRSSSSQLWQPQSRVSSGKGYFAQQIALSGDGSTMVVRALEPANGVSLLDGVLYVYQRSGSTWIQQAFIFPARTPQGCSQRCEEAIEGELALSSDGNLLAVAMSYSNGLNSRRASSAVVTYQRTGATWAQQASLPTGGKLISALALSGDGSTLAATEDAWDTREPSLNATTPFVLVFAQQGNGTWSQQARIPAGIVRTLDISGSLFSRLALSSDGSTLAAHALNAPGHPNPALDIKAANLSCGNMATDAWYIGLYARNGSTWQRQTAISRGVESRWALAGNGNALFYGDALFARNSGTWACP